ncbi:FAD-dependent oxidoreductase [Enterococcus sp. HY326]|uniref:FAD-dependent oxidoreductase n=1 Tax=Enterococcus sp. HY326 TaxID=2971265 RepID=UPI00223F10AD|nr:FAD-dependent oxidoreductase [Enterococcus sp. HY326]
MKQSYPHIYQSLKVGPLTLKNRLQFTPMVSCHATPEGRVTPELVAFLGMQARSGVGLVTIGATAVDKLNGEDFQGALSVTDDSDIPGLALLAEEVHRYDCKLSVELNHAGRAADTSLLKTKPFAASNFPLPDKARDLKVMTQEDIDFVVSEFADCAERCQKAGFDMVMIHGAHGNLIGSFLSPLVNKRTDQYGGSLENRMRFPLEVLAAVRERCGKQLALEYRISGDEHAPGGLKIEEVIEFAKAAEKYLDLIHISGGMVVDSRYQKYCFPTPYSDYYVNVENAAKVKATVTIPVATVGSIVSLDNAEEILAAQQVDIVGMARQNLADGHVGTKGLYGEAETIRPCIRCMKGCGEIFFGRQIRCSVNPVVGRETRYQEIPLSPQPKKVLIVGGGVAGMMAAQTARQRGHEVVLYEKENELGGTLHEASCLPFKGDLRRYLKWDVAETYRSGARIELGQAVDEAVIAAEKPDILLVGVGAKPVVPPIEGTDGKNVHLVSDVDSQKVAVGKKIVVCGGGLSGAESALALAMQGKDVTIVDMIAKEDMFSSLFFIVRNHLWDLLKEYNVQILDQKKIQRFTGAGVEVIDRNWQQRVLPADDIVIALGMKSNQTVFDSLAPLVPRSYQIGDSKKVGDIHAANHTAFNLAVEL